jgi:hypothetical protein
LSTCTPYLKKLEKNIIQIIIHKKSANSLTKFCVTIKKPTEMVGFLIVTPLKNKGAGHNPGSLYCTSNFYKHQINDAYHAYRRSFLTP